MINADEWFLVSLLLISHKRRIPAGLIALAACDRAEKPKQATVEFTWKDNAPKTGSASYYYVRGEQQDGEIVWVSPMWVTYTGGGK